MWFHPDLIHAKGDLIQIPLLWIKDSIRYQMSIDILIPNERMKELKKHGIILNFSHSQIRDD